MSRILTACLSNCPYIPYGRARQHNWFGYQANISKSIHTSNRYILISHQDLNSELLSLQLGALFLCQLDDFLCELTKVCAPRYLL